MHELVIKGGRVALDERGQACDIGIDSGRFAAFGSDLEGGTILDATGLWVLPGGIDAHCHLDQPDWGGAGNADDFRSGPSPRHSAAPCMIRSACPVGMSSVDGVNRSLACGRALGHRLRPARRGDHGDRRRRRRAAAAGSRAAPVKLFMTYEGFGDDDLF